MRVITLLLAVGLSFGGSGWAADLRIDETQVDRTIRQEPRYVGEQPLYGLVLFGPEQKTRVWMVLDQSAPGQAAYDVAYVDLNANGDLTEAGERFTATPDKTGTARFELPDFTDPATGQTHTKFTLRSSAGEVRTQMIGVNWNGDLRFGGGYPQDPANESYLQFAGSAREAPVVWLNGDGPFTFQRWIVGPLTIGSSTHVRLFIGVPGLGASSFCAFQVHALPEGEGIDAVLHYETVGGESRSVTFALLDKC